MANSNKVIEPQKDLARMILMQRVLVLQALLDLSVFFDKLRSMKKKAVSLGILLVAFFSACDDKIEEPQTSISGEVTGTYASGTPFNETFRFTQKSGDIEKFEDGGKGKYIQVTRLQGASYLSMRLVLQDLGLPTEKLSFLDDEDYSAGEFDFFFQKESDASTLVEVSCKGIVTSTFFRSMSIEANKTYQLVADADGDPILFSKSSEYYKPPLGGEGYTRYTYVFKNTSGVLIYFLSNIYDEAYLQKLEYPDGTVSTTDPLYKELYYVEVASITDQFRRKTSAGDVHLFEEYQKQDGGASILHHSYDLSTGRLTFDFEISVGASSAYNSTGHALTIKGIFDSGEGKIFQATQN
jgi:hypothetical protein